MRCYFSELLLYLGIVVHINMEEKKTSKQRCFAALSRDTVQMIGEAVGHSDLPEDVAALIAEDVTYRLRELTQVKCQRRFP